MEHALLGEGYGIQHVPRPPLERAPTDEQLERHLLNMPNHTPWVVTHESLNPLSLTEGRRYLVYDAKDGRGAIVRGYPTAAGDDSDEAMQLDARRRYCWRMGPEYHPMHVAIVEEVAG